MQKYHPVSSNPPKVQIRSSAKKFKFAPPDRFGFFSLDVNVERERNHFPLYIVRHTLQIECSSSPLFIGIEEKDHGRPHRLIKRGQRTTKTLEAKTKTHISLPTNSFFASLLTCLFSPCGQPGKMDVQSRRTDN